MTLPMNWKPRPARPDVLVPTPCHISHRNATRLQRRAVERTLTDAACAVLRDEQRVTASALHYAFAKDESYLHI